MMSQQSERAELRALQQKAYGRDGGLTDAEARRLRSLEDRAAQAQMSDAPATTMPVDDLDTAAPASDSDGPEPQPELESEPETATAPETARARNPFRAASAELRRHWRVAAVASVALLAIGIGAGWLLFGLPGPSIPLTAAQQERRIELAADGDYDEGSIRAVGEDDEGALVWFGTKDRGETVCVILDVDEQSGQQCALREEASPFGLNASVTLPGTSEVNTSVNASVFFSTTGEPVAAIQRWEQDNVDYLMWQFNREDRTRAEQLTSDGDVTDIAIIGSFRDEPVWLVNRFVNDRPQTCLIIDAADAQEKCAPSDLALQDGISTLVFVSDGADGSEAWGIQVAYTVSQAPYLVITRDPQPASITYSEYDLMGEPTPEATPGG